MNDQNNQEKEKIIPDESQKLISTGSRSSIIQKKRSKNSRYYFTTEDLLIGSILGIMGGFISGLIPFSLLVKTWFPFVGGTQLVSGHHLLWMIIAYGLTKKKPVIFFTAIIQGFLNYLFGSQWSILEIGFTLYEGLFLYLGLLIMQALGEGNTKLGWGVAAGLGNLSQVPLFWIITGKIFILHWSLFVMSCMLGFISGLIIAGLLGKLIVNRILKTGVI
ncbi:MAG: ECF transporter S component [Promethearchaeota archaeon]